MSIFAIVLICFIAMILLRGGNCCKSGDSSDGKRSCCFNYYRDGNQCKACPAGFFGFNCSSECNLPNYGLGCAEMCECDQCHHVYGCNLISTTRACPAGFEGVNCSSKCNGSSYGLGCTEKCECYPCHHVYGCNMTITARETSTDVLQTDTLVQKTNQSHGRIDLGRILIITIGSALSFVLISIIIYEIYKYHQTSNLNSVQPARYDVYNEICILRT